MSDRQPSSAVQRLEEVRALVTAGAFADALAVLDTLPPRSREEPQSLYLRAVALRYLQRLDEALATLSRLLQREPEHARGYQERAHALLARNEPGPAEAEYRKAVTLNPALVASWKALMGFARRSGNAELAAEAEQQLAYLGSLPRELLSAASMMHEGRLYRAEQLCRHFLQIHPRHVEGMRLLAAMGVRYGILDDAEFLLESAVAFDPDNARARLDYVNVLYRRQKFAESLEQARLLHRSAPENPAFELAYANQCAAVGDYDAALRIYDRHARRSPRNATLHLTRGHALKTVGRVDDAVRAYRQAYRARPAFGDAYWSLANLKTYRFTATEVAAMSERSEDGATPLEDRIHFCFALGKHHEDVAEFAVSFGFYELGNRLRKQQLQYDADRTSARLKLQQEVCTPALFQHHAGSGCPAPDPIFIVGLPRAGSTLLEQILASHSMVDGTLELQNITTIAQKLDGRRRVDEPPRYPGILADLTGEQIRALGERYLQETRIHRQGAPFFIDKLPNNFVHIGLISLILPNARFIDARRHPMGCCFSNFKQLFASGQEYTYGLAEVGRYYRDYVDLMDHWDRVLPGRVLRVQYEDVVADLEGQVRRILDHCGLPLEEACLRYHETERSIRTPSSEQVRQPIYRSGVDQWRRFEPYLEPLKWALGPVLERYPLPDRPSEP